MFSRDVEGAVFGMALGKGTSLNRHRYNFAEITFCDDLERTAANLAIGCKTLVGNCCVDQQLELLSAKGALDRFGHLHAITVDAATADGNKRRFPHTSGAQAKLPAFQLVPFDSKPSQILSHSVRVVGRLFLVP